MDNLLLMVLHANSWSLVQWWVLDYGSADVTGLSREEGAGGAQERFPDRGFFS